MSRELKFRVWDHQTKKLSYFNLRNTSGYLPSDIPDSQIQQFTGLKDKNGKDIYEGDIISGKFDMGPAGITVQTATIVQWTKEEGYQWNYWYLDTIEVVGNIFEDEQRN